jgi:UDP-N-acetylmuramoyl-L-alanyl-D-glutamate--2,6-diaminopimelate ligase
MSYLKRVIKKALPEAKKHEFEQGYRLKKAQFSNALFQNPAKGMKVIAITGTNGKTTTCSFVNEILKSCGLKTAVYTTAFTEIDGVRMANRTHMTVASAWSVQKFLRSARKKSVDWVILEVTSHALDQYRIFGVPIEIAAITNLTQDHLDYHGTMENYALAKSKLITEFNPKTVVLNSDDEWFGYFAKKVKNKLITIGKGRATYQIKDINLSPSGTNFTLVSAKGLITIDSPTIGEFNSYNIAVAVAIVVAVGCQKERIMEAVTKLPIVPGRMEPINEGQQFTVLVDYAHTPDALENALKSVKSLTKGKVRLVFGATGDRDKTKRAPMGEVSARNSDFIYLTDDETYSENGDDIRMQVMEGIKKVHGNERCVEIADRREAIKAAFMDSKAGDVVLLAGIGHQDYRAMGGKKLAWDEREVAREIIKELSS